MSLQEQVNALGPWVTKFEIDGETFGGDFDAMNDARITQFFEQFRNVGRVIELGSLEGGHSFALARNEHVKEVVALEARDANIKRAEFVKGLLKDEKVKFFEADVTKTDLSKWGKFDAVLCSGILYHLYEPWELIEQCSKIADRIFIWTQYAGEKEAKKFANGHRGKWYREGGWLDPLSGTAKYSFWFSMGSLVNILTNCGYTKITILENNLSHPNGASVTLAAEKA